MDTGNVLSEQKQKEVLEVVEKLEKFKPTKVAVEADKAKDAALNVNYKEYKTRNIQLTANEIHQLGFRISNRLNLENIYAVDWMGDAGNRDIGEVLDWAKQNQTELYEQIMEFYIPKIAPNIKELSILEALKEINNKERILTEHEMYLKLAQIGAGTEYVGIDWMSWWYQRNLIIYHNLLKLTENKNERILLLIGGAHVHLVSQFLSESSQIQVLKVDDYL
ncbi:DUF5694 domain-containing protein [Evansella sp. LMS18]|uniref:DUF5694 domain-containing protein n=1 Tax=Evansella sp. LMS18 TaxID=2924033 RepID=UPI0020D02171|nr:DUF5694 domain-containing protein [Evansella sp. LMS18]UTR10370.1 DUF5694 domain-containing protein [Evansella sp. LMS18]